MNKLIIFVLLCSLVSLDGQAQVVERRTITSNGPQKLTTGEILFREEATGVLIKFLRILEGVPKKKYRLLQIENFIDQRFTADGYIEVRTRPGTDPVPRKPKEYFRNLIGRYFGKNARLDSTSEISCRTTLEPTMQVGPDGTRQFVCSFTQYMIDRRNGQRVGQDVTEKQVTIIFDSSPQSPSAKIKKIEVVDNN